MSDNLRNLRDLLRTEFRPPRLIRLHGDEIAVQTVHGFWMVVPVWNLDVAIGIIRDGQIEPWTNQAFTSLLSPGATVVNVGANFGYYAALAAQHVGGTGIVHAVEANPVVFPFLVKSAFWSGYPNVIRAYNFAAVGRDDDGTSMTFGFDPQFIGGGNLYSRAAQPVPLGETFWSATTVDQIVDENRRFIPRGLYTEVHPPGRALDAVIDGPIDAMLIDAEGSECFVIDGARELIASSPELRIVMEWSPHAYRVTEAHQPAIDAMWDFLLGDQGFRASRICPETYTATSGRADLHPLTRDDLLTVPHSDLVLTRGGD